MRVKGWHPEIIKEVAAEATRAQFDEAAQIVADEVRGACPEGKTTRPMYRRGRYAGQAWTARDGGELKKSVRVVRRDERSSALVFAAADVRVYIGNYKAYYARIVEFYRPFVRPALDRTLSQVKRILGAR